jgi:hypothetical protein
MRAVLLVFMTLLYSHAALAESVPFKVCAESSTWMRPSPELQTNKIWNDARYKGFGKNAYAWTHDFLVLDAFKNLSLIVGVTNLSGLWTVKSQWVDKCYLDNQPSMADWIAVLSLLNRVKEVRHNADGYTVVVEPSGKGFQWIYLQRETGAQVLRFVTPEDKQLEVWDESAPPAKLAPTKTSR